MYQIEIKFKVNEIKDISNVLQKVNEQIQKGEFSKDNDGFLMNKYNPIDIRNPKELWDSEGYSIGSFIIVEPNFQRKDKYGNYIK